MSLPPSSRAAPVQVPSLPTVARSRQGSPAWPSALWIETTPPEELPCRAENGPRRTSMRSAPARLKCESWPWPSGIEAGMPSAYRRSPRTPTVARAPKARMDSCVSCARFWRSRASRPGMPRRTSETSALASERSPDRSMVAVEAGVSKAGTVRRRVASTTTGSKVVGADAGVAAADDAGAAAVSGLSVAARRTWTEGAAVATAGAMSATANARARVGTRGEFMRALSRRRSHRGVCGSRAGRNGVDRTGPLGPGRRGYGCDQSVRSGRGSDVAVGGPAFAGAAVVDDVGLEHGAGGDRVLLRQARVDRGEVGFGRGHQLLEAVDDEIGLLVGVDAVARAHDALEVEADPVGRGRLQRMHGLAAGGHDAAAVDAQAIGLADQPELHRVPVQAGQ